MTPDLSAAAAFMAGHARLLDRRRFELLFGDGEAAGALAALEGYRNPDGGYGWGLEPDLRSPESQPGAALHAFEVLAETAPAGGADAAALCDWLESVTLPDGGLPFARPLTVADASAPWWRSADPDASSLQITTITAAAAHAVPATTGHPWLERATEHCRRAIEAMEEAPSAYVLAFAIRFLDAIGDHELLARLGRFLPDDGCVRVQGGTEDEMLRPLDFAAYPGTPARELLDPEVVATDLDRLAGLQQDDGGWVVDYLKISPAGALEWRGATTVRALDILRRNGRLKESAAAAE